MPDLKAIGIDFVDFTGGEPTLAALFVQKVSRAAKEAGITCGIVTAGHWAASDAHAETFLSRFPDIEHWDISTDIYHREFVDVESVIRAFHTISKSRPTPLIRIAYHEPMTLQDAQLIDEVYRQVGERIAFQPVGPVGRGADLLSYSQVGLDQADMTPCPSTGPLVQTGGAVAPCCAPLSHESIDHPLRLGNAFTEPLTAIVTRWRRHPLLQTLRVWGFQPILQWLDEAGVSHASLLRHRVCHMCVELIRNEATCRLAAERASSFEHRIRLAYALLTIFNEPYLDNALRNEASEWLQINGDIEVSLL
jgi:hypothetical protein